jgi:choline transport protein
MASIQPIAGAQYHWTHFLAPPRHRRFITWMQGWLASAVTQLYPIMLTTFRQKLGWVTWFAWVSLLAGVSNTAAATIQELLVVNYPTYVSQRWHITFIIIAMLIVESLMNMYTFWVIPWIELLAGILHGALFIIFVVVLVTLAPRHSTNYVFFGRSAASGWDNSYVSWNLGLLTPTWSFVGALRLSELSN